MYGAAKKVLVEIIKKIREMKQAQRAARYADLHMIIPPEFMDCLKKHPAAV